MIVLAILHHRNMENAITYVFALIKLMSQTPGMKALLNEVADLRVDQLKSSVLNTCSRIFRDEMQQDPAYYPCTIRQLMVLTELKKVLLNRKQQKQSETVDRNGQITLQQM